MNLYENPYRNFELVYVPIWMKYSENMMGIYFVENKVDLSDFLLIWKLNGFSSKLKENEANYIGYE